jgi:TRAP-type mannitol/chloroaromatic compound transport system substrate-binding protein
MVVLRNNNVRNLIIGAIFGCVLGAVFGATFIGPKLNEKIPGFVKRPLGNTERMLPFIKNHTPFNSKLQSSEAKNDPHKSTNNKKPSLQWRVASAYSLSSPIISDLAKRVENQIWRVSDGRFKIQFHNPGTLVAPKQAFDAVSSGIIDAAFSSPTEWSDKSSALSLFSAVPFGSSAREYMAWFYFSDGQKLFNDIYHKRGIHSLICGMSAQEASGWFNKKIQTPEDLMGLRMRISGLGAKVMQKLGVKTQTLSDGEVLSAFKSGLLDAAEFYQPSVDLELGLHKVAFNYYFPGWHQPATLFEMIINLGTWKALSPVQKSQLETVCGDNIRYSLAQSEAIQFNALKKMVNEGVILQTWPTEVLNQLNTAWRDVVAEETLTNENFGYVWRSQKAFREEFSIWHELTQP